MPQRGKKLPPAALQLLERTEQSGVVRDGETDSDGPLESLGVVNAGGGLSSRDTCISNPGHSA